MEIKQSLELKDGSVEFTGTLDSEEVSFLLEFAINQLLAMGVTPFVQEQHNESASKLN